jgi:hypothetical protein
MGHSNQARTWVTLVADALAERHPLQIPGRIEAARQAIHHRTLELAADPDAVPAVYEAELRAMEDALRDLWDHERKYQHGKREK